jgi:hypothetical protein
MPASGASATVAVVDVLVLASMLLPFLDNPLNDFINGVMHTAKGRLLSSRHCCEAGNLFVTGRIEDMINDNGDLHSNDGAGGRRHRDARDRIGSLEIAKNLQLRVS